MTPVQRALTAGFVALQGAAGRTCLFRGQPVIAVIDDTGGAYDRRPSGGPSHNTVTGSIITIRVSDLATAPRQGEFVVDDTNRRHNVALVELRGDFWRLTCRPFQP